MTFVFSGTTLRFVDFQKEVEVDAQTIDGALAKLAERFPAVKPVLFDREGRLRSAHRLFFNSEMLVGSDLGKAIGAGDRLEVVTAIAGG